MFSRENLEVWITPDTRPHLVTQKPPKWPKKGKAKAFFRCFAPKNGENLFSPLLSEGVKESLWFALFGQFSTRLVRLRRAQGINRAEKGPIKGLFRRPAPKNGEIYKFRHFLIQRAKRIFVLPFFGAFHPLDKKGAKTPFLGQKWSFGLCPCFCGFVTRDGTSRFWKIRSPRFSRLNTYHARFFRSWLLNFCKNRHDDKKPSKTETFGQKHAMQRPQIPKFLFELAILPHRPEERNQPKNSAPPLCAKIRACLVRPGARGITTKFCATGATLTSRCRWCFAARVKFAVLCKFCPNVIWHFCQNDKLSFLTNFVNIDKIFPPHWFWPGGPKIAGLVRRTKTCEKICTAKQIFGAAGARSQSHLTKFVPYRCKFD